MPAQAFFDLTQFDYDNPVFNLEQIREVNPQRGAMEHLSAIAWVDTEKHHIVGFKDVRDDEFWIEGHMPGFPLMPGVIQCEAAAQLAGFYARKYNILGAGDYLGFGGMSNVRFRKPVFPGCRLIIAAKAQRIRPPRRAEFEFQGFVDGEMMFEGEMFGVPISRED